jgi:hypothetical protein
LRRWSHLWHFLPPAFAIEPDYLYIGITLNVLVIMLNSLLPA